MGGMEMICPKLQKFFDSEGVKFQVLEYGSWWERLLHRGAYTAMATADKLRVPPGRVVKTVVLGVGKMPIIVVVPANCYVDFKRVREFLKADAVWMPDEKTFVPFFKSCEPGAMCPFGNLYGILVLVDKRIAGRRELWFKAGSHWCAIRMSTQDFLKLLETFVKGKPELKVVIGEFATERRESRQRR